MNTIVLLLASFIFLQGIALAVPDSVTAGPYKVSFDLGLLKDAYSISVSPPSEQVNNRGEKNIIYNIIIKYGFDIGPGITITETNEGTLPTLEELLATCKLGYTDIGLKNNEFDAGIRQMGGSQMVYIHLHKPGVKGMSDYWDWEYYPLAGTRISIFAFPEFNQSPEFMDATMHLVDTIHVEKMERMV